MLGGSKELDLEFGGGPTTHHISTLQFLLRAAHSADAEQQERAARQLATLVESTVFPAVSFGPLVHALTRLIPSEHPGVVRFASRAVKTLLLDDALRPAVKSTPLPAVLVTALGRWKDEPLICTELLGGLQTLLWDRTSAGAVVDAGVTPFLLSCLSSHNYEVALLALSTLANLLSYSDTLILANTTAVQQLAACQSALLELTKSQDKSTRVYAVAALANGTAHPIIAGQIARLGGNECLREVESQNKANLSLGGTRVAECAETAVLRLSGSKDPSLATRKYKYKFGNKTMMELALDSETHRNRLQVFVVIWVLSIVLLFYPLVFSHRAPPRVPTL
jgi:hypothetical protein